MKEQHRRDIVADDGVRRSVAIVFADTRADNQFDGQGGEAADRVHDASFRKVRIALAESEIGAELGQPSTAPGSVSEQRIRERAQQY